MKLFENEYRIVTDKYSGYEAQVKFWWFPMVWWQMHQNGYLINTFQSIFAAKAFIRAKRKNHAINKTYGDVAVTYEELMED